MQDGLSHDEAARRLAEHGPNLLPEQPPKPVLLRLLGALAEPLSLVLLAAGLLSILALGEALEGAAILAIVALNAVVGTVQQQRAEAAMRELKRLAAPTARVRRGGETRSVPAAGIVPGDVVELAAGDRVPADVELLEAPALATDETLLTGESLPVEKRAGGPTADAPVAERSGLAFAGTLVVRGRGLGAVRATGARTHMGQLALGLGKSPPAPLERDLARATRRIAALATALGLVVGAVAFQRAEGNPWGTAILATIAVAVAAIPEGLLAAVTTAMALGARRMAKRGAIVRHLPAVEALGATSVLCVDKTGTLTTGQVRLHAALPVPGEEKALWECLLRCNDAHGGQGDPLDVALRQAAAEQGVPDPAGERTAEEPFDPATRMMATVHSTPAGPVLSVKGAPEAVLPLCRPGREADGLAAHASDLARQGLRVLAAASAPTGDLEARELQPLGLAVFSDPLRPTAREAVGRLRQAGIRVVMVTGDRPETAAHIAAAAGLDASRVVAGRDLAGRTGSERMVALASAGVLARVEPGLKVELVEAHQKAGHVVAMTGDGVNDAPALARADVGVAVAGEAGTEVAREAADLVVTDGDLGTIAAAVAEGRRIYRNVQSVVAYLLIGNVSELAVMLFGLLLFPELAVPLLPVQLLWVNLVTDGLPALALGVDTPPHDLLAQRPRDPADHLLHRRRMVSYVTQGILLGGLVLASAWLLRRQGATDLEVQSQLLASLMFAHLLLAFAVRAPRGRPLAGWWRNGWLMAAIGGSLALQLVVALWAPAGALLGVVPVGPLGVATAAGCAAAGLLLLWGWGGAERGRAAGA